MRPPRAETTPASPPPIVIAAGTVITSPRHRHPENCSDSLTLGDFARRPAGSLKPLHKIRDLDLVFDANICDGHLHRAEPFLDTFHPFVLTQCRQALRDGLEQ